MKRFIVRDLIQEFALRGNLNVDWRIRRGVYAFAADEGSLGEAEASEARLTGSGTRMLMLKRRSRDDDLEFLLSEPARGMVVTFYPVDDPDLRVTMNLESAGSVVKLLGVMAGAASPGQELDGRLYVSGSELATVRCYEPQILSGDVSLHLDPKAAAVPLIAEAIQVGRDVRIKFDSNDP
jgi:hypothetical protein